VTTTPKMMMFGVTMIKKKRLREEELESALWVWFMFFWGVFFSKRLFFQHGY